MTDLKELIHNPYSEKAYDEATVMEALWLSFRSRPEPEAVAALVARSPFFQEHKSLRRALQSLARKAQSTSSHLRNLESTSAISFQAAAAYLFPDIPFPDVHDRSALWEWVTNASWSIGRLPRQDFRHDRLNREKRGGENLDLRRGQYNRRYRFLARLEHKLDYMAAQEPALVARVGIARQVTKSCFLSHGPSACHATYLLSTRAENINHPSGDYTKITRDMFSALSIDPHAHWRLLAWVDPNFQTISRLSPDEQLELMFACEAELRSCALRLRQAWSQLHVDPSKMVVRKGIDSSKWNALAGAWNRIRQTWINVIAITVGGEAFGSSFPGKAMRLVGCDLAGYYKSHGLRPHPDMLIWSQIPFPWKVVLEGDPLTAAEVERICARMGIDARKTGWTDIPRDRIRPEFQLSPELLQAHNPPDGVVLRTLQQGHFAGSSMRKVTAAAFPPKAQG